MYGGAVLLLVALSPWMLKWLLGGGCAVVGLGCRARGRGCGGAALRSPSGLVVVDALAASVGCAL